MSGSTDLQAMLATMSVTRRSPTYTVVHIGRPDLPPQIGEGIEAVVEEEEGLTIVCTTEVARSHGWPVEFVATWLTLDVHSALDAVGLTAAFAAALGAEGIPCNVLAGFFHDHMLVPVERADDAVRCLEGLRNR